MPESSPENRPDIKEDSREIDLEKLSFAKLEVLLKEASELAKKTFREKENGFENAVGNKIIIEEREGKYKIVEFSRELTQIRKLASEHDELFRNGSEDREQVMQKMREIIIDSDSRIIE